MKRRIFIKQSAALTAGIGLVGYACSSSTSQNENQETDSTATMESAGAPLFQISLAEWSLHKAILGDVFQNIDFSKPEESFRNNFESLMAGSTLKNIDFPQKARALGVDAVEYVNTCFYDKAKNTEYLTELKNRCNSEGVTSVLIMCDLEGDLGHPDMKKRMEAVENHYKWADAAKFLGCHSIRVNARSEGSYEEQQKLAAEGLAKLGEYGEKVGINIIVENHGGFSSNGEWLVGAIKMANNSRVGTLPDFGNFCIKRAEASGAGQYTSECVEEYDRYKGVEEMMPYAKGVSAKTHEFDDQGNETETDYTKMMKIVLDAGYRGHVGIEYEGSGLSEEEGIIATRKLLEKVREELTPAYS